jgi:hypothetical protein
MNIISVYTTYILISDMHDSINWFQIIEAMKEFGIPIKLICLSK